MNLSDAAIINHTNKEYFKSIPASDIIPSQDSIEASRKLISNLENNLKKLKEETERNSGTNVIHSVNKNAYEIRLRILELSVDVSRGSTPSAINPDIVLDVANKFYKFVENKK